NEELLRREVHVDANSGKASGGSSDKHAAQGNTELLSMLRGELQIKNQQIAQQSELISKQMELISGLSERLREGNVLLGSLQQRLALPENRADNEPVSVKTSRTPSPKPEKGSTLASKAAKPK